jgi:hypothetical protein
MTEHPWGPHPMFAIRQSSSMRSWCLSLSLLAILGVSAIYSARTRDRRRPDRPPYPIEIDTCSLDFGEVVESNQFHHKVRLRNVSSQPVKVRLEKHCDCVGIEPERLEIGAGETGTVSVRLDLMHNRHQYFGRTIRPYEAHFAVYWGTRARDRFELALRGSVRATLEIWPPNLHLKEELVEGEPTAEEFVEIKPLLALQWLVIKKPHAFVDARLEEVKGDYKLYIRANEGLAPGLFKSNVILQSADAKGKALPEQAIAITGMVTSRFVATPAETTFGFRQIGTVAEEVVRIHSRRTEPLPIIQVKRTDPTIRVLAEPGKANEGLYRIQQSFVKTGASQAGVEFLLRDGKGKEHTVKYRVAYYGMTAK